LVYQNQEEDSRIDLTLDQHLNLPSTALLEMVVLLVLLFDSLIAVPFSFDVEITYRTLRCSFGLRLKLTNL